MTLPAPEGPSPARWASYRGSAGSPPAERRWQRYPRAAIVGPRTSRRSFGISRRHRPVSARLRSPCGLEIEQTLSDLIAGAQRYVYSESQYFASRRIASALAARLQGGGKSSSSIPSRPKAGLSRFSWIRPGQGSTRRCGGAITTAASGSSIPSRRREPIYVHAEVVIVDDVRRAYVVESERRPLELDTECDVVLATSLPANAACGPTIRAFRDGLLAEHFRDGCGLDHRPKSAARSPVIAVIEELRGGVKTLCPYQTPDLAAVEEWLAENDVLGSGGTDEPFEPLARRTLFRRSNRSSR